MLCCENPPTLSERLSVLESCLKLWSDTTDPEAEIVRHNRFESRTGQTHLTGKQNLSDTTGSKAELVTHTTYSEAEFVKQVRKQKWSDTTYSEAKFIDTTGPKAELVRDNLFGNRSCQTQQVRKQNWSDTTHSETELVRHT